MIDPLVIRSHFPIFDNKKNLVYLDNASTTQKPRLVIDGVRTYYENENANIHRGLYENAIQSNLKYDNVRQKVAQFIGADDPKNIVFTSGTTDGINLVAQSFLEPHLMPGDEVIISTMEHHANLIPWQIACQKTGAQLKVVPLLENDTLDLSALKKMLSRRCKLLSIVHISNSLGIINPIQEVIELAKKQDISVLIDAAQSAPHHPLHVKNQNIDFLVFSGHKMYGPTGVGILYAKSTHLEKMAPIKFGGDMIKNVNFEKTIFADYPRKLEAGTTNIAGIIGLGYAIDFIQQWDQNDVLQYLKDLSQYATEQFEQIDGLKIYGSNANKSAIVSFTMKNIHPHDIATFLAAEHIAVRAGHHCTQPLMDYLKIPGTLRASFSFYNTKSEIDKMATVLKETKQFLE